MGLFRTAFLLVLSAFALQAANAQLAIGQWREHFGYRTLNLVLEAAGKVYAASDIGVLEYDPVTHEMRSLTKVNGLNDVNITALAWSEEHGALLVGYRNGNLDVVRGASTTNISDIRRSNVVGDKTINAIRMDAGRAYLACGFGIVQVDLDRAEIRDTYIIGNNATPINVWDICFFGDSIRAATEVGLFSVARSEPNPAAFFNWHRRNDLAVPGGAYRVVVEFMGKLVVAHDAASGAADSVYMLGGSGWEVFEPAVGQQVTAISTMGDRITLTLSGYARQFDAGGNETAAAYDLNGAWIGVRWAVARSGGGLWVAASYLGLLEVVPGQTPVAYLPNAPKTNGAYRMALREGPCM